MPCLWYLQLAGTPALMTLSGPHKQPEQTGVCTACYTDCYATASGCPARYAATDSRYMVHWKIKKQAKTLRGRKDSLALVYFYWRGDRPPRPLGIDATGCKCITQVIVNKSSVIVVVTRWIWRWRMTRWGQWLTWQWNTRPELVVCVLSW